MICKKQFKQQMQEYQNVVLNQMGKVGSNKILMTITDSFAMLIPILIAGSIGIVIRVFLFATNDAIASSILGWIGMAHTETLGGIVTINNINDATANMGPIVMLTNGLYAWNPMFNIVNGTAIYPLISQIGSNIFVPLQVASLDHIALYVLMAIAFNVSKSYHSKSPILAIIIAVGAFFLISGGSDGFLFWSGKNLSMDAARLLPAMFTGFVFVSIFEWLSKNPKMHIKMVAGVPPAVSTSFAKLLPAVITLLIALGINGIFSGFAYFAGLNDYSLAQGISDAIQAPFLGIVNSKDAQLGVGLFYCGFVSFLWFFGLHGTNVLGGIFAPIMLAGTLQNEQALSMGTDNITVISGSTFEAFTFFGGSGASMALVIATLIISKRKAAREITVFGGPPAIFNINEPIIFGYPIILNFVLLIPFIIVPMVLFAITYIAIIVLKWVPATSVIIPWPSPIGIGAFLATQSWTGIVLAFFNLIVATLIYAPFVILANKTAKAKGEELVNPYAKFKRLKANLK